MDSCELSQLCVRLYCPKPNPGFDHCLTTLVYLELTSTGVWCWVHSAILRAVCPGIQTNVAGHLWLLVMLASLLQLHLFFNVYKATVSCLVACIFVITVNHQVAKKLSG